MAGQIRPLTDAELSAVARAAAEQCIPLGEANYFEPGSKESAAFTKAYTEALAAETV
ncbi:hypothetical protein HNP48_002280 [Acidovorax soli]|uniref:Uncharacterized protein n=1 Tax=Acidovorax soli TaxID=592050 RepID=A0A7X0PCY1_9BURK|nr:hypothetical protein [Acidovorax soli]MBB6559613.1 hypothetical protein [Acidovorax soli]